MYQQYKSWEKVTLRGVVTRVREAEQGAMSARDSAMSAVAEAKKNAEAQELAVADSVSRSVRHTINAYPEMILGGVTISFGMVSFAPKRTAVLGLLSAFALRSKLADKYGGEVTKVSASLSDACKSKAEAFGLLRRE